MFFTSDSVYPKFKRDAFMELSSDSLKLVFTPSSAATISLTSSPLKAKILANLVRTGTVDFSRSKGAFGFSTSTLVPGELELA